MYKFVSTELITPMIRTLITPDKQDVSIHIPESYIGKQIEILLYAVDELN